MRTGRATDCTADPAIGEHLGGQPPLPPEPWSLSREPVPGEMCTATALKKDKRETQKERKTLEFTQFSIIGVMLRFRRVKSVCIMFAFLSCVSNKFLIYIVI